MALRGAAPSAPRLAPLRVARASRRPPAAPLHTPRHAPRRAALPPRAAAPLAPGAPLSTPGGDLVAWREWELGTTGADYSWPEPLTPQERISRSLRFWSAIGPVIIRYQLLQAQLGLPGGGGLSTPSAQQAAWDALNEASSDIVAATIAELRGFYTKSGQLIGSRPDLFPEPFTRKLAPLQDSVPAMDGALLVRVVETELLGGAPLSSVFSAFDAAPLGSASVAQVHRAVLRESGVVVAVKVQRPGMEALMLGDVANVKALAAQVRGRFPVDYYTVFSELEAQLAFEFDFEREARSLTSVADALDAAYPDGPPVRVPRPVAGLVAKRVLVMDFIPGAPLTRLADELAARGIAAGSLAAQVAGRKLLRSLTDAFGVMLLGTGFFHGDPHPGNIMLTPRADVALIDFGQVKQLQDDTRRGLARIMLLLEACGGGADAGCAVDYEPFAKAVKELGVRFKPGVPDETAAAAALAFWLFDSTATALPGGYDAGELSLKSPVAEVASFPQELVFVGRSTVLIRGLATRLGVPWCLAREWAPAARAALAPPEERAAALPPRRCGILSRVFAALLSPLTRFFAALRAAIAAAFLPAFAHMRNTSPTEGCAFTP